MSLTTYQAMDGSVFNPDKNRLRPCGAGIVIKEKGFRNDPIISSFKVSEFSTSFQGEITAIRLFAKMCWAF